MRTKFFPSRTLYRLNSGLMKLSKPPPRILARAFTSSLERFWYLNARSLFAIVGSFVVFYKPVNKAVLSFEINAHCRLACEPHNQRHDANWDHAIPKVNHDGSARLQYVPCSFYTSHDPFVRMIVPMCPQNSLPCKENRDLSACRPSIERLPLGQRASRPAPWHHDSVW